MKKYLYLLLMLCFAVALPSCGDDDDPIDDTWKERNQKAFGEKAFDTEYTRFVAPSNVGVMYYKQITPGNGKRIYYNSRVDVYYEGSLIDGTVFDKSTPEDNVPFKLAMSSAVANYSQSNPTGYTSNVILGWTEIMQFMEEGEEGIVWIPQELAYGETGNDKGAIVILPYSTLIFKLKVAKVTGIDEF